MSKLMAFIADYHGLLKAMAEVSKDERAAKIYRASYVMLECVAASYGIDLAACELAAKAEKGG